MIIAGWNIRETRYPNLGYLKIDDGIWRFVDLQEYRENGRRTFLDGVPCVGISYKTKQELLADLEAYARSWGY